MITAEEFNKDLEDIVFPRVSGGRHEEKAFQILREKIKSYGIKPKVKHFRFTTFFSRLYPKISMVLLMVYLVFNYLDPGAFLADMSTRAIIGIFLLLIIITRRPERLLIGFKKDSKNFLVDLNPLNAIHSDAPKDFLESNDHLNIYFMAHVDSKSQRFSIRTRMGFIRLWFIYFPSTLILIIIKNCFLRKNMDLLDLITLFPLSIFIFASLGIIFNTTNNKSPGAVDNGSGMICLLQLLKYFAEKENRPNNIKLNFLFTGAEECGTIGIRVFYNDFKKQNRGDKNLFLNFDAIGKQVYVISHRNDDKEFDGILGEFTNSSSSDFLNLRFKKNKGFIGIHTDGYYLKKRKLTCVSFGDWESLKYIHSEKDTLDKIDPLVLKSLCEFIIRKIHKIDVQQCHSKGKDLNKEKG